MTETNHPSYPLIKQNVVADQETEWKFVRSKLYMEYIKADCTLPVPLNIIPTPRTIASMFTLLPCCIRGVRELRPDEEDVVFTSMNGGGRLLDNKVALVNGDRRQEHFGRCHVVGV
ncbi:hypothetical protein LSH36_101g05015 [Paralvinella palmiformis]|uniref:Uncharacterized protein n=1 Tax=Paralvinella palmiformis TaxID=53620 RepID=A0AAD9NCK7_9ANNE|nr:hypothetical protein LSH36_101g05015 [Paralvinella palmiformis]